MSLACCSGTTRYWILSILSLYLLWDLLGVVTGAIYVAKISKPDSWEEKMSLVLSSLYQSRLASGDTNFTRKNIRDEIVSRCMNTVMYLAVDYVFNLFPLISEFRKHSVYILIYKLYIIYAFAAIIFGAAQAALCLNSSFLLIWSLAAILTIMSLGKVIVILLIVNRLDEIKVENYGSSLYPVRSSMDVYTYN